MRRRTRTRSSGKCSGNGLLQHELLGPLDCFGAPGDCETALWKRVSWLTWVLKRYVVEAT